MSNKRFKDPIYGYIEIDSDIVANIIDTPAFQRLKDIRQTSYTPLYPAAYHNRFIHSIGVYYLGRIAFNSIESQLKELSQKTPLYGNIDRIRKIFELACLLHDVGHAPFSHTGETFYVDKSQSLYKLLTDCVNDALFTHDFEALGAKKPAPHECMSCIVGIRTFPEYFLSSEDRCLFARCIIGMQSKFTEEKPPLVISGTEEERAAATEKLNAYKSKKTQVELLNCVISLLNSSIIDVDRLDYIIRDAATIGFKSVQVDYMRLLDGMRIVTYEKQHRIGYHKNAISVIESAIYAHDAEKKWVQSHPSILYEIEALKNAMGSLTSMFATIEDPNPLFCYEALTETGKTLDVKSPLFSEEAQSLIERSNLWTTDAAKLVTDGKLFADNPSIKIDGTHIAYRHPITLLADEDFLYLMKQYCKEGLGFEYFARNRRRAAVWKSEAEFRALFQMRIGDGTVAIKTLESGFESLVDYCQAKTGRPIVTEDIFAILNQEEAEAKKAKDSSAVDEEYYEDIMQGIDSKRFWANILHDIYEEIVKEVEIAFEFLIVFQKQFSSSFKATIGEIPILFPNAKNSVVLFDKVVKVLKGEADLKSNFFHIYYKPQYTLDAEQKKRIVDIFVEKLISAASTC